MVVGNGVCALAMGDDKSAYGFGYGETEAEARRNALRECRKQTTNGKVVVCTGTVAN